LDNPIYHFWRFFVVLVCIASSLIYAYLAAFGVPEYGTTMFYIDYSFEVIFACDMIVQFLLEFKPEDQYNRVRDLTEIAKRLQSQLDLISKEYSKSVLVMVAQAIENGFEVAAKENRTEEILKRYENLSEVSVDQKGYKKFALGSLGALVGMSGLAFLAKAAGLL